MHQSWSREQQVSWLIARLPEKIGAMKVDSGHILATRVDAASPLPTAPVEIVTVSDTPRHHPRPPRKSDEGTRLV